MTNLSKYCRARRESLDLRPAQVARKMGYANPTGCANKIVYFEERGYIKPALLEKLTAALEINQETIDQLVDQDRRDEFERWKETLNQPFSPYLLVRPFATFTLEKKIPAEFLGSETEMQAFAAQVAAEMHCSVALMLSRRRYIWIDKQGNAKCHEVAFDDSPEAMQLGQKLFRFNETGPVHLKD